MSTITIALKPCGCPVSDACDCAQQAWDARTVLMPGLVDRARSGDREAFGQVYAHYRAPVFRFIYRRVNSNHQLAEDLTSETFARALANVGKFAWQGRDFGAWLTTIARNIVSDHFGSATYRRSSPVDMAGHDGHTADTDRRTDPEQVAEHNELSELLDRVIAALTPEQRRVLALRFGEGLTTTETAAVMRVTPAAVKALQFRATQSLRRALTGDSPLTERC